MIRSRLRIEHRSHEDLGVLLELGGVHRGGSRTAWSCHCRTLSLIGLRHAHYKWPILPPVVAQLLPGCEVEECIHALRVVGFLDDSVPAQEGGEDAVGGRSGSPWRHGTMFGPAM